MSVRARVAVALALGAAACAAPAPALATVHMTTDPGLRPAFDTGIGDYVSRCVPGQPLHFAVSATSGDRVAVGGNPERTGNFSADVTRQTGDVVGVRVTSNGRTTSHHVRCLPRDFPAWTFVRRARPQAAYYVVTPLPPSPEGYLAIFDGHGVPVWWFYSSAYGPWDGKLLPDGNLVWARQLNALFSTQPGMAWEEHRLDGSKVREIKAADTPTDWHDLEPTADGNYLIELYRPRKETVDLSKHGGSEHSRVYDGEVQELSPEGKLLWRWNSAKHIKLSETRWWSWIHMRVDKKPESQRIYDLIHLNAVQDDGDGVIISSRFTDALYRIRKKDGSLDWKLGGTHRKNLSLDVKGDRPAPSTFSGNHDVRLAGDGTVTVFDNGTLVKRAPRVARFRVDRQKRTAKLVEQFKEGRIPDSGWGGSARKLPGGNWVVQWGGTPLMSEYAPGGKPVLDIRFEESLHSYRAFPILPGQVRASALRQGMTAVAKSGMAAGPGARR
jgi:hypothetical protein